MIRKLIKNILILSFVILTINITPSCKFNTEYINRVEDKEEAEEIVNQFYEYLKKQDFESIINLHSESFFDNSSKKQIEKLYANVQTRLGKLKKTELDNWQTKVVIGTNAISTYFFIYKNSYEMFDAMEKIRLIKEEDGQTRVISYDINSEGLLPVTAQDD